MAKPKQRTKGVPVTILNLRTPVCNFTVSYSVNRTDKQNFLTKKTMNNLLEKSTCYLPIAV